MEWEREGGGGLLGGSKQSLCAIVTKLEKIQRNYLELISPLQHFLMWQWHKGQSKSAIMGGCKKPWQWIKLCGVTGVSAVVNSSGMPTVGIQYKEVVVVIIAHASNVHYTTINAKGREGEELCGQKVNADLYVHNSQGLPSYL